MTFSHTRLVPWQSACVSVFPVVMTSICAPDDFHFVGKAKNAAYSNRRFYLKEQALPFEFQKNLKVFSGFLFTRKVGTILDGVLCRGHRI